jgi:FkbM family methyltransferase
MGLMTRLRRAVWDVRDRRATWRCTADWASYRHLRQGPVNGQQQPHGAGDIYTLQLRIHGCPMPVHVRRGTSDVDLVQTVLRDEEYRLPRLRDGFAPRTILDLGANIGLTTLYYAALFPEARIWSVEPSPANLPLLRQNTYPLHGRVTVVPCAVGEVDGDQTFYASDDPRNFGGGSFKGNAGQTVGVPSPVRTLATLAAQERIPQPDLIKLDVEGYEGPALRGAPPQLFAQAHVIIGELHDCGDDWTVLDTLSRTHRVGVHKDVDRPCSFFVAVRKPTSR